MTSPNDRSIPVLLGEAVGQLSKLISNEFELARAEASDKFAKLVRSGAMIGAGAVLMIPALVVLLIAGAEGMIAGGLSRPVAYLIVAVVAVAISAALVMMGVNRMTADKLLPRVTIDQLKRDKHAAKEMVR
ncbi:MAG: hypothetical protein JWR73_2463 [Tardiphaga sp.]|nr:hypothetical protein [Tardiphaga sp.]MDB5573966.1 hypothetical protein [Tardiphaga sp.]MDB5626661.1 hypothetical protein [Tardiphaga sp.]MDB5630046.1 hypothetical protein [Tardiphaga sp.]